MSDSGQPLDRLNYFNGERLEAADLRVEQSYHIYVRRALNRSLYSAGIAAGLEVTAKKGDLHKVTVCAGLALDAGGREIILLEARDVQVVGAPSTTVGVVFGNYLVIEYVEAKTAAVEDGCSVPPPGGPCKDKAWGGPTRIRADVKISWRATWPKPEENQIVLAQVELTNTCAVRQVHTNVRKYADKVAAARVRPFALEGDANIDAANSRRVYFHIRGGSPDSVVLYLKGEKFSSLFYTEMGQHGHGVKLTTGDGGAIAAHTHEVSVSSVATSESGEHRHVISANLEDLGDGGEIRGLETDPIDAWDVMLTGPDGAAGNGGKVNMDVHPAGKHTHDIHKDSLKLTMVPAVPAHTHAVTGNTESSGTSLAARLTGAPLTYLSNLVVLVDGTDLTAKILSQLAWTELGNGKPTHAFVTLGTGPLDLRLFGADFKEGQHVLELRVATGGGGAQYNLYVE